MNCNVQEEITVLPYLFGYQNKTGLNHILIELKKQIFYDWKPNLNLYTFGEQLKAKIRKVIIKEKHVMIQNSKFEEFWLKWKDFRAIYDFLGPDFQFIN